MEDNGSLAFYSEKEGTNMKGERQRKLVVVGADGGRWLKSI